MSILYTVLGFEPMTFTPMVTYFNYELGNLFGGPVY